MRKGLAFVLLLGAAVAFFFASDLPPVQDAPGHAGLIALRHRIAESAFDQRFFRYEANLGPYSLFRLLGEVGRRIHGPLFAARLLSALPIVTLPVAVLYARRRLHRDESFTMGYVALAFALGLPTIMGLAAYLLGLSAFVALYTFWASSPERPSLGRRIALAGLAVGLYLTHGHAFLLFAAAIGLASQVGLAEGSLETRARKAFAVALVLLPAFALAAFVQWTTSAGAAGHRAAHGIEFRGALDKVSLLATPSLMTRYGVDTAAGIVLAIVVVALLVRSARGDDRREARRAGAVAALFLVAFAAMPRTIGWFGFADGRLVLPMLLMALVGARLGALGPRATRAFAVAAPVLALAVVATDHLALRRFRAECRGFSTVLAEIPAETSLLYFPTRTESDAFSGDPFRHFDKLAVAAHPTLVGELWAHQGAAIYLTADNPATRLPIAYTERNEKAPRDVPFDAGDWEMLLLRSASPPEVPSAYGLVRRDGDFWLFRRR
ncbi:MAG: hypothetical protein HOO96_29435 [Polyangiaceae bacterium]|nr:hypothetical protein [Polyangiaceae bacterium]